jgi:hypothetical protein
MGAGSGPPFAGDLTPKFEKAFKMRAHLRGLLEFTFIPKLSNFRVGPHLRAGLELLLYSFFLRMYSYYIAETYGW